MILTELAAKNILHTMKKNGLNPREVVFEFILLGNGGIGVGFNRDRQGTAENYGELTVMIGNGVEVNNMVVDFQEINGRKGLIFLERKSND